MKAELTQQQVAYRLQRPQSFVSDYESGGRHLTVPMFIDVCEALGADPHKLIRKLKE